MDKNEIILFETEDKKKQLSVQINNNTVWLSLDQMAELFEKDRSVIGKHIRNVYNEKELEENTSGQILPESIGKKHRPTKVYNLDVIISVGYRVKSKRGVEFRRWATKVLRDFFIKGYAVNEKRLEALQKTVTIQTKMLANTLNIEEKEVLRAVNQYTQALLLLDQYDHHELIKPKGNQDIYQLTYEECRQMIDSMEDTFKSDVFGVEKEIGKVEGIIAAVYQNVFGQELYPSLEEKAANLLYFMIKDHPFADGCKRIAASLFLEFLYKNNALFKNDEKRISDGELVAITLMIAESNPNEKDVMVNMIMNLLTITN